MYVVCVYIYIYAHAHMRRCVCPLGRTTGLDVEKMETKAREFTLAGDYRRILARPEDISWERISYKDPYADLQPSGLTPMAFHHISQ